MARIKSIGTTPTLSAKVEHQSPGLGEFAFPWPILNGQYLGRLRIAIAIAIAIAARTFQRRSAFSFQLSCSSFHNFWFLINWFFFRVSYGAFFFFGLHLETFARIGGRI